VNLDSSDKPVMTLYGAAWCPHCKRVKKFAAVVARERGSDHTRRFPAAAAFVFIGLKPNSAFLGDEVQRDAGGFLVTSPAMETSMPGVFAAGDVRAGSTKQLGSAAGDGIAALLMTRRYLELLHHKAVALADA
jgi:thioredoxin reductase (NADPH)